MHHFTLTEHAQFLFYVHAYYYHIHVSPLLPVVSFSSRCYSNRSTSEYYQATARLYN